MARCQVSGEAATAVSVMVEFLLAEDAYGKMDPFTVVSFVEGDGVDSPA